jgi:hypothetical protein
MTTNDDLAALCALAKNAGANIMVVHDAAAFRTEGRTIIESVTVHSGIPGIGPHPMGPISAAERLREAMAKGLLAPVIVSAEIGPMPRPMPEGMLDPMPVIRATFADGQTRELFRFYPDEITFEPGEFVGLTFQAACQLRFKRDVDYLQSHTGFRPREGRDA